MNPIEIFNARRLSHPREPQLYHLGGKAGTGKTTTVMNFVNPSDDMPTSDIKLLLCASTGIAAINLGGVTTINQVLKYFDAKSIEAAYGEGHLARLLHNVSKLHDFLVIDECGMIGRRVARVLYDALNDVNSEVGERGPLGIIFMGDFAQLPPIPDKIPGQKTNPPTPWMFNEGVIGRAFSLPDHKIILQKIWRQTNPDFLEALNYLREGNGSMGVIKLRSAGVNFIPSINTEFIGTSIVATNDEAKRYNQVYLNRLESESIFLPNFRWWGGQVASPATANPAAWNNLPEVLELKVGAYVMLLSNKFDEMQNLIYGNGDCGIVEEVVEIPMTTSKHTYEAPFADQIEVSQVVKVRLIRNDEVVTIHPVVRQIESDEEPSDAVQAHPRFPKDALGKPTRVKRKPKGTCWITGQIRYFPLTIARYLTAHKTQSLTIDRVQIDPTNHFFGSPAMIYVAVSRVRSPENLFIVGNPAQFAAKVKTDPLVKPWI